MAGRVIRVLMLTPVMFGVLGWMHGLDVRMQDPPKPEPLIDMQIHPDCGWEGAEVSMEDGRTVVAQSYSVVQIDYVAGAGATEPFFALENFFRYFPNAPFERFLVPDRMNSRVARYDLPGFAYLVLVKWPGFNGWVLDSYAVCPSVYKRWT